MNKATKNHTKEKKKTTEKELYGIQVLLHGILVVVFAFFDYTEHENIPSSDGTIRKKQQVRRRRIPRDVVMNEAVATEKGLVSSFRPEQEHK